MQIRTLLVALVVAAGSIACASDEPRATIHAQAGARTVRLEVVSTPAAVQRGLMYRTELPDGDGMLFVFQDDTDRSFWMKNTYIPLDLLFIAREGATSGRIAGIHANAKPLSTASIRVGVPSRWVLEVPGGWCARNGVAVGDTVELAHLPAP